MDMVAEATNDNKKEEDKDEATLLKEAQDKAELTLKDYQTLIDPDGKKSTQLNAIITKALGRIKNMKTVDGVNAYVAKVKADMDEVVKPKDDDDDDDDDPAPVNADHFLMVGGNWVTPVANAGQTVSIVLPVVPDPITR